MLQTLTFPLIGGLLGLGYYKLIGCSSGSCPITSSPYASILYGIFLGILLAA
ncbi:DUF6132 family protein [Niameybacter massiliensis]|uniref:DUF6132 family protein n=1 Tax=Holtiella tumoricola TaxID=3018743 RepID=A0AA42J1Y6_9FIRM|nr:MULTISPECIES: DUF6132 family protein [Lachnospirales]MDA3733024.1 DUF6132 family protein [Holtiella tumoricola]